MIDRAHTIEQVGPLPIPLEPRSASPKIVLVVPAHDEEEVLALAYAEIKRVMDSLDVDWSIIFVNDGSRDSTLDVLEEIYQGDDRVSYISLSRNFGHQSALAAGLDNAAGDVVITLDADLQHPPDVIPTLLEAWQQGYDIVHTRKVETAELGGLRRLLTEGRLQGDRRYGERRVHRTGLGLPALRRPGTAGDS